MSEITDRFPSHQLESTPSQNGEARQGDHSGFMTLWMYRDIARASRLTGAEYRLLDALTCFADGGNAGGRPAGGNCFPTRERLAEKIGRSVRTVDDLLKRLVGKGWIRVHACQRRRDGWRSSNLFQFLIPPEEDEFGMGWEGPVETSNRAGSTQLIHQKPNSHVEESEP